MHTQQSNVLKMCFLMSRYYTLKMLCVTIMIHMLEILLHAYESKPIGDGNKLKNLITIIDFPPPFICCFLQSHLDAQ